MLSLIIQPTPSLHRPFQCAAGGGRGTGFGFMAQNDLVQAQGLHLVWTARNLARSLTTCFAQEISKWLGDRLDGGVLALSESSRENVVEALCKYTRQVSINLQVRANALLEYSQYCWTLMKSLVVPGYHRIY
jgi:ribose 1,5-bisphosphokinase PhnN